MIAISLSVITFLGLVTTTVGDPVVRGRPNPQAHELKRAACTTDSVLRALQSAGPTASTFCSSYIGIPVKTVYTDVPGVTAVM